MDEFMAELDEDVEGMQSTIYYLQQQLREAKETISKLETEKREHTEEPPGDKETSGAAKLMLVHETLSSQDKEEAESETEEGPAGKRSRGRAKPSDDERDSAQSRRGKRKRVLASRGTKRTRKEESEDNSDN